MKEAPSPDSDGAGPAPFETLHIPYHIPHHDVKALHNQPARPIQALVSVPLEDLRDIALKSGAHVPTVPKQVKRHRYPRQ